MMMMRLLVLLLAALLAGATDLPCNPTTDRHCSGIVPKDTLIDDTNSEAETPSNILKPDNPVPMGPSEGHNKRGGLYGGVAAGSALLLVGALVVARRRKKQTHETGRDEDTADRLPDAV